MHQLSLGTERSSLCPCFLILLQEGGPLPGPETGLLSNIGNELSEETHGLTKQETLLGKGTRVEYSKALSKDGGVGGSPMAGMILSLASEFHLAQNLTKPSQA